METAEQEMARMAAEMVGESLAGRAVPVAPGWVLVAVFEESPGRVRVEHHHVIALRNDPDDAAGSRSDRTCPGGRN